MNLKMVLIGGGGSSGTHMLASVLHNIGDMRAGPEAKLTHQKGLYNENTFKETLYKNLFFQGNRIDIQMGQQIYSLLPGYVFYHRGFYGFKHADDIMDLYQHANSISDFIYLIKKRAASELGWPDDFVWVEHSPGNGICAGLFLKQFPDAKFIHLVRDGRDALASQANRFLEKFPEISASQALHLTTELWCLGIPEHSLQKNTRVICGCTTKIL